MSDKAILEGATQAIWRGLVALESHLEARNRELNDEIGSYPTPIARCDVQLSKLLEQRARLVRHLQQVQELSRARADGVSGDWTRRLDRLLMDPDAATDDDIEAELRYRLRVALSKLYRRAKTE